MGLFGISIDFTNPDVTRESLIDCSVACDRSDALAKRTVYASTNLFKSALVHVIYITVRKKYQCI